MAGTTLEDVKVAAEVSGSQMYHYFPDKNELVQAVIDYQAETIVNRQRHTLGSVNRVEAWRNMVMTAAKRTKAKGGCQLGSLVGQLAESDPEARALIAQGSISGQPPSAMGSDPFMPTGNSRPTSTRTTSPSLCSPRSKEDFFSPRYFGVPVRSKLRSIPSSPLPSADEPKPGSTMTLLLPERSKARVADDQGLCCLFDNRVEVSAQLRSASASTTGQSLRGSSGHALPMMWPGFLVQSPLSF